MFLCTHYDEPRQQNQLATDVTGKVLDICNAIYKDRSIMYTCELTTGHTGPHQSTDPASDWETIEWKEQW